MARWNGRCLVGVVAALLGGCVVQSFHPFYTEESKVDAPGGIIGQWKPVRLGDTDEEKTKTANVKPWVFSKDDLQTYDKKNVASTVETQFFKLDGVLYCDFTARGSPEQFEANIYWTVNIVPVHTLCKVELEGDRLTLKPVSYSWMKNAAEEKKLSLPYVAGEDLMLFTATPEQWEAFLKEHGKDPEVFPEEDDFVFTRVK